MTENAASKNKASETVIPGRCEASNPESRDYGSGPSDHPGMTPNTGALLSDRSRHRTRICEVGSSVCRMAFPHLPQAGVNDVRRRRPPPFEESQCDRGKPTEDAVFHASRAIGLLVRWRLQVVSAGLRERHEYRKIYRARPGIHPIGADARHARGTSAVLLAPYAQGAARRCRGTGRWPD